MEKKKILGKIKSGLSPIGMIVCTAVISSNSNPAFRQFTSNFISIFSMISAAMFLFACIENFIGSSANEHIDSIYQDRMRSLFICVSSHLLYFLFLNFLCDNLVGFINIAIDNLFINFGIFCILIYDFANDFGTRFLLIMCTFYENCEKELKIETEKTGPIKSIQNCIYYIIEVCQKKAYK